MTQCTLALAFTDGERVQHEAFYSILAADMDWRRAEQSDVHWSRRSNVTLDRNDIEQLVRAELNDCLSHSGINVAHFVLTIGNHQSIVGAVEQTPVVL